MSKSALAPSAPFHFATGLVGRPPSLESFQEYSVSDRTPVCVLDIRGLLLRRFHSEKKNANEGIQAFLERDLEDVLQIFPPINIYACWDRGNDFRTAVFDGYKKARREKEVDQEDKAELDRFFRHAKAILRALGVKQVSVPGCEADDVIALLCEMLPGPITVWTIDADLLQLVEDSPDKKVIVRQGDSLYTSPSQLHNGVPVGLTRLYKSIVGDSSDGYSGVPGIGQVGWNGLIEFVGLDGMEELEGIVASNDWNQLQDSASVSGDKNLKKLCDGWGEWTKCYLLAKLHPSICHEVSRGRIVSPEWDVVVPNEEKLHNALHAVGAQDMASRYLQWMPTETLFDNSGLSDLSRIPAALISSPIVSFDFESYDTLKHEDFKKAAHGREYVDVLSQRITGLSVNYGSNCQHTFYISTEHAETANVSREWVKWILQVLFSRTQPTVAHNANFEVTLCLNDLGFSHDEIRAPEDTSIMATYVNENLENHLKGLSLEWLGYRQATYKEVVGDKGMNEVPAIEAVSYACDDSLVTSHLFSLFRTIMQVEGSWRFYQDNEIVHAIDNARTFIDGCPIDTDLISKLKDEDNLAIVEADSRIRRELESRCVDRPVEEVDGSAKELLKMWWELPSFSYRADEGEDLPPDKEKERDEKYAATWEKAWQACFYTPYREVVERPEFTLTPTNLNNVTAMLGCDVVFDKSLSGNQVSSWLEDVDEFLADKNGLDDLVLWSQQIQKIAGAAAKLQKRPSKGGVGSLERPEVAELPEYQEILQTVYSLYDKYGAGKRKAEGDELNWASSKQMQAFLYGKLSLPVRRRSKVLPGSSRDFYGLSGAPATGNKAATAAIVYDAAEGDWRRPVLTDYMRIIACQQNISLFYDPYPLWVHPRDKNIHPQVRNCGTVTRRPSGTSPNILQVSKKDGAKIRRIFLPWRDQEQYIHVSMDFTGQEVVVTACESNDQALLDALRQKKDVHSVTASGFAHIMLSRAGPTVGNLTYDQFKALKEENPEQYKLIRNAAKAVLFLMFYGGGAGTLAENLLITKDLAQEIIDGTFAVYTRLVPWQNEVIEFARKHGYVETAYGNRRHLTEDIFSDEDGLRSRQERQAVNMTIQGTCADILKIVLSDIRDRDMLSRYRMKGLKPVYDEISSMVPLSLASAYISELREVMEVQPPGYPLRLSTDVSVGLRWGDVKEISDCSQENIETVIAEQLETENA